MKRSEDSIKGLTKLKMLITKLQRGLFSASREDVDGKSGGATVVPKDVKKGHFAVVAEKGGKPKRFVLELGYLSNPEFLSLLKQAEQEYGFQQKESQKDADDGEIRGATKVPNNVKEGHFAVVAVKGGEPKRFVLELSHLSNPEFLTLLEQAKMEYGFQQKGVLAVPCRPEELQNVLKYKRNRRISTEWKSTPSFSLKKEPTSVYVSKVASLRQQFFFWRRDG